MPGGGIGRTIFVPVSGPTPVNFGKHLSVLKFYHKIKLCACWFVITPCISSSGTENCSVDRLKVSNWCQNFSIEYIFYVRFITRSGTGTLKQHKSSLWTGMRRDVYYYVK